MSMLGINILNDIVKTEWIPGKILGKLDQMIKTALHQSDDPDSPRDGMDIALIAIEKNMSKIYYAGANRPLWLVAKDKELQEWKATRIPIGGYKENDPEFITHEIKTRLGDSFYFSSDGYADQNGGEFGKKLMTKKFKEVLQSINDMGMKNQEEYLKKYIKNWQGEHDQRDDILVIGIKI